MQLNQKYTYNPVTDLIGKGGFGRVYKARDEDLGELVALKRVSAADIPEGYDLIKEVLRARKFIHINLCAYYDGFRYKTTDSFGEEQEFHFAVMEYINGGQIDEIGFAKLPDATRRDLLRQILDGLSYLHSKNVIHRDVKPSNILIQNEGSQLIVKITDFGISKHIAADYSLVSNAIGSIEYMPPEQFQKGGKIGYNADIWSFGVMLYELMTGELPFGSRKKGNTAGDIMYNVQHEAIPEKVDNLSEPYRSLIKTCLIKDREKRPRAAQEILDILSGKKDVTNPISPATQVISKTNYTEIVNGVPIEMVFVQGGSFMMGATPEQGSDVYENEKPAHKVSLDSFYIGKFPVTQKQWKAVMGVSNNPSYFKGEDMPVDMVSWDDAQFFIQKLNQLTGKNFRLPAEAEWEYAARGGAKSRGYKYSGSNNIDEVAWYWKNSGDNRLSGGWDYDKININNCKTHPVGYKKQNELGIYDMSGNLWEWCEDDWHDNYNGAPNNGRAWVDVPRFSYRILRGGSWDYGASFCRVSNRSIITPNRRSKIHGFRLVLAPSI
jgi:eukaryotic-like serine/threonine-protein kinase